MSEHEFKNIAAAIFLLDQDINAMEFLERLKNIVINFNDLTSEEKLLLKGWIKNTTNSNEIYNMNELVDNTFNGLSDYYTDKIRSLPEGVIDKIATDIFDLETVEDIKKYL